MQNVIHSMQNWYNPFCSPSGKQIEQIIFYDKTGVVLKTVSAWFGSNNAFKRVFFSEDIKNRRKVNFDKNEFFTADFENYGKQVHTLFIPTEKIGFECLGEKLSFETKRERSYLTHYKISAEVEFKQHKEGVHLHEITFTGFSRSEKTQFGQRCEDLSELAKSQDVKLSAYDIERLLNVVDITTK